VSHLQTDRQTDTHTYTHHKFRNLGCSCFVTEK